MDYATEVEDLIMDYVAQGDTDNARRLLRDSAVLSNSTRDRLLDCIRAKENQAQSVV